MKKHTEARLEDAIVGRLGCANILDPNELEIPNAIRLKRFRGEITKSQETAALRSFYADVDAGRFERPAYDLPVIFIRAEQLSAKFSPTLGTRSLNLWHVAAAQETGCITFVSFDARQRRAAELAGLRLLPIPIDD